MHKKGDKVMKKGVVMWLVVALVLIIAGAGIFFVGVICGGSKSISLSKYGFKIGGGEDFHYESDRLDKIENINIDVSNLKIVVAPSQGDYYKVICDAYNVYEEPQIEIKDGALTVKQKGHFFIFNFDFNFLNFKQNVMTIYVPNDNDFKNITINSSNSAVIFEQALNADYVKIDTKNGPIRIKEMVCDQSLDAKTSNGGIDCEGTFGGKVTLDTNNGAINCEGTFGGKVTLDTSNGVIDISGKYAKGVEAKSSNGRISAEIDGRLKDYNLDLDTSNGSVRINGDKVEHDYRKDNNSDNKIILDTSNGSIELDFSE